MVIGRVLPRQAPFIGEGHQLATQFQQGFEQPFRMQLAQAGQVHEPGMGPVQHLQQHEIRHIRNAPLPGRTDTLGDSACPLPHQARHFPDKSLQPRCRSHTQHGRDEVRVHHQAAVRALLKNPADGQGRIGTAIVSLQHQAGCNPAHIDGVGITVDRMQIPDFQGVGTEPARHRGVRPFHFGEAVTAQWQGQVHDLIGHGGIGDFHRLRHHIVLGQTEAGAIREQAGCPNQANPAETQVLCVQFQVAEAIQIIGDRERPFIDLVFQISLLLLEVLGLDEQAITPDDSIGYRHQVSSECLS